MTFLTSSWCSKFSSYLTQHNHVFLSFFPQSANSYNRALFPCLPAHKVWPWCRAPGKLSLHGAPTITKWFGFQSFTASCFSVSDTMFINYDWISVNFLTFTLQFGIFCYLWKHLFSLMSILIHLSIFSQKYLTSLFCFFKHIFYMIYFLMNTIFISFDIQKKFKFKKDLCFVLFLNTR